MAYRDVPELIVFDILLDCFCQKVVPLIFLILLNSLNLSGFLTVVEIDQGFFIALPYNFICVELNVD